MPVAKTYDLVIGRNRIIHKWGMVASPGEKFTNNVYFNGKRFWSNTNDSVPNAQIDVSHLLNQVYPSDQELNRLYDKVKERVMGPQGALLTSSVEWKSSLGMITSRANQILTAYSAVKKLQFSKASAILRLTPSTSRTIERQLRNKRIAFSPTSAWLEYWMGWAPLIGDIAHAMETIIKPPPLNNSFSVGTAINRGIEKSSFKSAYDSNEVRTEVVGKISAYGKFEITNHNLMFANQLGLLNPARVLWEVVPFSFIVDWFTNIGTVIGSLTDFVGVRLFDTGYAIDATVTASGVRYVKLYDSQLSTYYVDVWTTHVGRAEGVGYYKKRDPGPIQAPRLDVKMLDRLSLTRAATSISLLVEIFLKK